jgi:hypothetical protein
MFPPKHRLIQVSRILLLASALLAGRCSPGFATDYFLTIGGGYNPAGNQASLEANVVFFQRVLDEKHHGTRSHHIYFSDGHDPAADLQVLAAKTSKSDQPATDLLAALHRRRGEERLEYRNHRVPDITDALNPKLVHARLEAIAKKVHQGDRLIVYVTAHGSEGTKTDPFNTTIDCWNEKKITAREFTKWLGELPPTVPVVMVMAQCYCGGFGHAIFNDLDESKGLAPQLRAGFFAQRHDLPAAGCRPDIRHDEEFSSYFWGAIAGRSRNGVPITGCDIDGDGVISFAEAYAHAVIAGQTIDIPLRTSDVLLRTYSRMTPTDPDAASAKPEAAPATGNDSEQPSKPPANTTPANTTPAKTPDGNDPPTSKGQASSRTALTGKLQSFIDQGRPVTGRIISGLSHELGFSLQDDAASVVAAYDAHRRKPRRPGQGGRRRPGGGRREFLLEIADKWPDLADPKQWEESPLLKPDNQEKLFAELKQLPGWKSFDERRRQSAESVEQSERHELREVKFRRLISTLETVILEKHLPAVAPPDVIDRYRQLIKLEESPLGPPPGR